MSNPTPAPIVVPASGAPTCRGVALTVRNLVEWGDGKAEPAGQYEAVRRRAQRAIADGCLLCLRPTADRPACVGLTATMFADASLQADFAARALVVDPYDAEGNDLREAPSIESMINDFRANLIGVMRDPVIAAAIATVESLTAEEAHDVAVWEGSEAVES